MLNSHIFGSKMNINLMFKRQRWLYILTRVRSSPEIENWSEDLKISEKEFMENSEFGI